MYKPDFKQLDKLTEEGYLRKVISPCGKLMLYNYTDKCTYEKKWNEHTLNARGTVYEVETGKVVFMAFPKFFNFGELAVSKQRNLFNKPFKAFEKVDGSFLGLFYYNNEWHTATRGSFTSDQAIKAKELLHKKYPRIITTPHNQCYRCEVIYPENRIILDYGDTEELVLLSGYDLEWGSELAQEQIKHVGEFLGIRIAEQYLFNTLDELIEHKDNLDHNEEGFVVLFDNGERVKFKSPEYLRVARLMSNMTPLQFWRNMTNEGIVDTEFLKGLPEEFEKEAQKMAHDLQKAYLYKSKEIWDDFTYCAKRIDYDGQDDVGEYCKPLGLLLKEEKLEHGSIMFACLKGDRDSVHNYTWKQIRPDANKMEEE